MNLTELVKAIYYLNWTTWTIILLATVGVWFSLRSRFVYNLAPGPKGYPFVGHLLTLLKKPHIKLNDFRKKYGPIFSIRFGRQYSVILGDFQTIKDTFKMEGLSTRVSEVFALTSDLNTVVQINGKEWHDRRRFAISVLRGTNRERSTEDIIQYEVTRLLESLEKRDLSKDIDLDKVLSNVTNNVGFSIVCGKSYSEDEPEMEMMINYNKNCFAYLYSLPIVIGLGIPKFIFERFFPVVKSGLEVIKELDVYLKKEIAEHEQKFNPENPRDFIDFGLLEMQKPDGTKKTHDYQSLRGDSQMLLLAGTDAVRITLEWCLLALAKYPTIQEKAYQEIVDVLGDRRPMWADHSILPYVQGFILESQRVNTLVPLNVFRRAPRDIKIKGYDVPKGTWIISNNWGVNHDRNLWTDPEKFDPTRFLNKEGTKAIEPEFWFAFSIGNRNCLGDKLAKTETFLALSSLIQQYRVLPSSKGVSFEEIHDLVYRPKYPEVRFQKRAGGEFKNI